MQNNFKGRERREFERLDYIIPLAYKICKRETISKILEGYTSNISQSGALCRIKEPASIDDFLWLSFDRGTLSICQELEKRALIYQNGIIGKVVRVEHNDTLEYKVGIKFITREEENATHIYPKIHFMEQSFEKQNE